MRTRDLIRIAIAAAVEAALAFLPAAAFAATVAIGLLIAGAGTATAGGIDIDPAGAAVRAGGHGADGIGAGGHRCAP